MNCQALNDKLPRIGLVRAKPAVDLSNHLAPQLYDKLVAKVGKVPYQS
jgi:hypothetical protein